MAELSKEIDKPKPITFLQAMGVMFIGLKLAGEIDWHWGLVLIPIWMLLADWVFRIFVKAIIETIAEHRR